MQKAVPVPSADHASYQERHHFTEPRLSTEGGEIGEGGFKLGHALASPGSLLRLTLLGLTQASDSGLGHFFGSRICIFNKFPGEANDANLKISNVRLKKAAASPK